VITLTVFVAAVLLQAAEAAVPAKQPKESAHTVDELIVTAPKRKDEPEWASRLNFDVRGNFSRSPTPLLRRAPVNGCRPMAGGAAPDPIRDVGGFAGGLACAKSF
jgi:hypothetical protein